MNLKSTVLQMLMKPKKVHSLPGRLRVHLPFLSKIDPSRRDLAQAVSELLTVPEDIRSAEVTLATGNVLLHYDAARITENEVFNFLKGMLEIFLNHRTLFQDLPPEKTMAFVEQLKPIVRNALGQRLYIDTKVEIPKDVLA